MASIVDSKYAKKYREGGDWTSRFIDDQTNVPVTREKTRKGEDGQETTETVTLKRTQLDLDKLFELARANHIDAESHRGQIGRTNAPGRLRMTLGNMLRAAARRQLGLRDLEGEFHPADADTTGERPQTQDPATGERIALSAEPAEQAAA